MSNQDALKDCLSKVKDDKLDEYVKKLGMDLINPVTKDTAYVTYITKLKNLYDTLNGDNGNIATLKNCITPTPTNYGLIVGVVGGVVVLILAIFFLIKWINVRGKEKSRPLIDNTISEGKFLYSENKNNLEPVPPVPLDYS